MNTRNIVVKIPFSSPLLGVPPGLFTLSRCLPFDTAKAEQKCSVVEKGFFLFNIFHLFLRFPQTFFALATQTVEKLRLKSLNRENVNHWFLFVKNSNQRNGVGGLGWGRSKSQVVELTPRNMFRLESKPAAKILARFESLRSTRIRHANREIVLCITFESFLSPGSVSITTKSIGTSDERPTYGNSILLITVSSTSRARALPETCRCSHPPDIRRWRPDFSIKCMKLNAASRLE